MISFEPEIERLRDLLGDPAANRLAARERREIFSLHPEIRFVAWGGTTLIAGAAALFLSNYRERIGPVAIAILIGVAAAACYAFAFVRRGRVSLINDAVLLLGALLVNGDVAFIETQFHLFGPQWNRHLLILTVFHGFTAYAFDSRMVLTLSITSLATWIGVERDVLVSTTGRAMRFFASSAAVIVWTLLDRRLRSARTFDRTFEHFAANFAFLAAMSFVFDWDTRGTGALLTLAIAAVVIAWGVRSDAEPFVLYAIVYAVLAVDVFMFHVMRDEPLELLFALFSTVAAIVLLFVVHARFRRVT